MPAGGYAFFWGDARCSIARNSLHACAQVARHLCVTPHNHHNHHKSSVLKRALFCESPVEMDTSWQPVTGAAQRRKQRRLRSWWRHEQRNVAAALAAADHHSAPRSGWPEQHYAPRGPMTTSAMEVEADVAHEAPRGQEQPSPGERPAPPSEVAGRRRQSRSVTWLPGWRRPRTTAPLLGCSRARWRSGNGRAKEAVEVDQLEERLREVDLELVREVERVRRLGYDLCDSVHCHVCEKKDGTWLEPTLAWLRSRQAEHDEHFATGQAACRSWSQHCVRGRVHVSPHVSVPEGEVPEVGVDHAYMGPEGSLVTIVVCKCTRRGCLAAAQVPEKGAVWDGNGYC